MEFLEKGHDIMDLSHALYYALVLFLPYSGGMPCLLRPPVLPDADSSVDHTHMSTCRDTYAVIPIRRNAELKTESTTAKSDSIPYYNVPYVSHSPSPTSDEEKTDNTTGNITNTTALQKSKSVLIQLHNHL